AAAHASEITAICGSPRGKRSGCHGPRTVPMAALPSGDGLNGGTKESPSGGALALVVAVGSEVPGEGAGTSAHPARTTMSAASRTIRIVVARYRLAVACARDKRTGARRSRLATMPTID